MKGVHKNFDVKKVKEYIVNWIKEWFDQNGKKNGLIRMVKIVQRSLGLVAD